MRGALLLARGAHRQQAGWFVNYDDGLVEMNDPESVQRNIRIRASFRSRDSH